MKPIDFLFIPIAALVLAADAPLQAAPSTFTVGNGQWSDANNWTLGKVPDATTEVKIGFVSGTTSVCWVGDKEYICKSVTLGNGNPANKGSLVFLAGSLTVASGTISKGGEGDSSAIGFQNSSEAQTNPVTIKAKSITTHTLVVGQNIASGIYTIPAGQAWDAQWVFLGNGAGTDSTTGTLTVNGGSLTTVNLYLSGGPGTTGIFTLTGGILAGQNICRKQGTATFIWNDGTIQTLPDQLMTFFGAEADKPLNIQLAAKGTHALAPGNEKTITVQETAAFVDLPGQQGTLTINGPGTVSLLSSANTYSGITRVQAGTLTTGTTGVLGKGDVEVASGSTLTLGNNASLARTSNVKVGAKNCYINLNYTGSPVTIASLSLNGTPVRPGTYTAAQLNALAKGQWFGTGSLTVTALAKPSAPAR